MSEDIDQHDERLRFDIWRTIWEAAPNRTPNATILEDVAYAYEGMTGRKWERTRQDPR